MWQVAVGGVVGGGECVIRSADWFGAWSTDDDRVGVGTIVVAGMKQRHSTSDSEAAAASHWVTVVVFGAVSTTTTTNNNNNNIN